LSGFPWPLAVIARYFAVLLRGWPRGMSKTQCPV
jgi:hypothetical protein